MAEELNRRSLIELLECLGSDEDADVLKAGRKIHDQISGAGVRWDDLLVPDDGYEEDWDEDQDEEEDQDGEEDEDEVYNHDELTDDTNYDDGDEETDQDDVDEEDDLAALSNEEKQEALGLIEKLLTREISAVTKNELEEYKADIEEDEFGQMDLRYLRAMNQRLGKVS